jgi:hypothetical protein
VDSAGAWVGASVVDGAAASVVVSEVGTGAPGGNVAAGMNRQLMFPSFSALDQQRTRTHGRNGVRDDGIILRGAAVFRAVTHIEIPILNTAQAVEVHGRTGEFSRPVQRTGVTLLLSGCQRCPC